jgi:hypothetical protein
VQAIWVVIAEHGRTITAIVPREAMEERWDVGPDQDDLLRAFAAHREEIEAEVRRQATIEPREVLLVKDLAIAAPLAAEHATAAKRHRAPA